VSQLLLFPHPKPLVDQLGAGFFHSLPDAPGVYLMRDSQDEVVYVGKARNLKKRLCSYRVANGDRLPRRILRLLHRVRKIDFETLPSEKLALDREAELLLNLRPRFNRAGTWPSPERFLQISRPAPSGIILQISEKRTETPEAYCFGPHNGRISRIHEVAAPLIHILLHPKAGPEGLPPGWANFRVPETVRLNGESALIDQFYHSFLDLLSGKPSTFIEWSLRRSLFVNEGFSQSATQALILDLMEHALALKRRQVKPSAS
jgi:predicted GIY-YIG superfamily endonuclease